MIQGLAFAGGFMANVEDAYRYLMETYDDGDRIFLFGFSRGAYTARALAALLDIFGLLCRGNEGHIPYMLRLFNQDMADARKTSQRSRDAGKGSVKTVPTRSAFKETFSHRVTLHFVGLWDTVSSVGWITQPMRLLYSAQNPIIQIGRHAVSIDERRCFYQDNLWGDPMASAETPMLVQKVLDRDGNETFEDGRLCTRAVPQDIVQVWFPGVHSDIGGSYRQSESTLSNNALEWMLVEAKAQGLRTQPEREKMIFGEPSTPPPEIFPPLDRYAAVETDLYRKPVPPGRPHQSLKGFWWWLLEYFPHSYYTMDTDQESTRIPRGSYRTIPNGSLIHRSAVERLGHGYAPPNLLAGRLEPEGTTGLFRFTKPEPTIRQKRLHRDRAAALVAGAIVSIGSALWLSHGRRDC